MKLVDVRSGKETDKKLSKANLKEAQVVINEITSLTNMGVEPQCIKVITPYIGQRDLIRASQTHLCVCHPSTHIPMLLIS